MFVLKALLYYNGVEYDENSNKEALVTLVRSEILDIDDGAIDDWEPPGDNEILWKSPVSITYYCMVLHLS